MEDLNRTIRELEKKTAREHLFAFAFTVVCVVGIVVSLLMA